MHAIPEQCPSASRVLDMCSKLLLLFSVSGYQSALHPEMIINAAECIARGGVGLGSVLIPVLRPAGAIMLGYSLRPQTPLCASLCYIKTNTPESILHLNLTIFIGACVGIKQDGIQHSAAATTVDLTYSMHT